MNASNQISLFYSYAHADVKLRDELNKHLSLLRRGGFIATWSDRDIRAGTEWEREISKHLNEAQIILLLVSPDFMDSEYCYSIEMNRALERHEAREAHVSPILLRPVDWQGAPFAKLQILPQNACPVTTWGDRDLAFSDIAIRLREVVEELQKSQTNISLHQEKLRQSDDSSASQRERTSELVGNGYVSPYPLQVLSEFRHCQKKVSELKSVHNMLHDIEVQLEGLSATIQLVTRGEREEKKLYRKWPIPIKKEIDQYLPDFDYIEIIWRQVVLKIDDLTYFAAKAMQTLDDERFRFDRDLVRGAPWVKDLFILQKSFEVGIGDRNIDIVKKISNELLTKCRSHLYRIDKRLLDAVKELDISSDSIVRQRT